MAIGSRLIRRRIRSVGNTRKITKAMELVSAAKMRRSVAATVAARRFAHEGATLISNLAGHGMATAHRLFVRGENPKVLCMVIASDRGLCGAYNASLLRAVQEAYKDEPAVEYVAVGRRAELGLRRAGRTVIASFPSQTEAPRAVGVRPIVSLVTSEFLSGSYGRVHIAYTDFHSALRQEPRVTTLLPFSPPTDAEANRLPEDLVFEPSPAEVLEYVLPRFLESTVYQAVLESAASEHSARMVSMKNATDAAVEMIDDLTFTLNQARQSAITSEIAEISAGRAALSA